MPTGGAKCAATCRQVPTLTIITPLWLVHLQGLPMETYLTAFSYGSVVIFNAQSDLLTQALLNMCREFTKSRVDDRYAEELMVRIRPDLAVRARVALWCKHQ
jgi:hypothetical protein